MRTAVHRRRVLAAGWSQGAGILVFLVARRNGIDEVSSLVPAFAIAAVAVLLQSIDPGPSSTTWRRPGAWAAAVGIVPWGVIGFTQIGAGIAGIAPPAGVRVLTLVALAVVVLGWWLGWRMRDGRGAVAAMTVGVAAAAWSVALG